MKDNDVKEAEIVNEKESKKENSNNTSNNLKEFLNSKVFYTLCAFILGALIMHFLMLPVQNNSVKNVSNTNYKTTTVEEESDLKNAIKNVYDSTVYIEVSGNYGGATGSGFVYKADDNYGYILTNYHVIENGEEYKVTFTDKSEVDATLVGGDSYYDIAVLKVSKDAIKSVAVTGDSSTLELGDTVFTVGSPLGKEYMGTITKGIVSGTNRTVSVSLSNGSYLMEVIQIDASINSGNSGGALCNIKGEVIGITSSKLVGSGVEGMGFAIPIKSVMNIIDNIESGKEIVRPYLGVQLVDISNTFALQYYYNIRIGKNVTFGAVLSSVEDNKPASNAGLKVGDVIVEVDGEKVEDVSHFKYILYKHNVGDSISVKYYRNNSIEETTINLSEAINK